MVRIEFQEIKLNKVRQDEEQIMSIAFDHVEGSHWNQGTVSGRKWEIANTVYSPRSLAEKRNEKG